MGLFAGALAGQDPAHERVVAAVPAGPGALSAARVGRDQDLDAALDDVLHLQEPQREISFAAYAEPTILGEIERYFLDRTWAVRVPSPLQDLALRVELAADELAEKLHRKPSVAEIAVVLRRKLSIRR